MEALLYFALWAAFIFVMMRLGCGSHITGHNRRSGHPENETGGAGNSELRWVPPKTDIDPVCKKSIATSTAKSSVHEGNVYYFCSRDCREVFEAAPHIHVSTGEITQKKLEPSHV